jgi:hypothetical protein
MVLLDLSFARGCMSYRAAFGGSFGSAEPSFASRNVSEV